MCYYLSGMSRKGRHDPDSVINLVKKYLYFANYFNVNIKLAKRLVLNGRLLLGQEVLLRPSPPATDLRGSDILSGNISYSRNRNVWRSWKSSRRAYCVCVCSSSAGRADDLDHLVKELGLVKVSKIVDPTPRKVVENLSGRAIDSAVVTGS